MKALFTICDAWSRCWNESLQDLYERKIIKGENFKWPTARQLEKLDEICSSCKHFLEIKEAECPVCGGTVVMIPDLPIPSKTKENPGTQYFYRCINCKRHLYSFHKLV
jgi:uncharacterized protein with PIN domain